MDPQAPRFPLPLLPTSFLQKYPVQSVQRPDVIVDPLRTEGRRSGEVQFLQESSKEGQIVPPPDR